ncbi:LCP family protein [Streptomyces sp. B1866]|uniref:LCP family protein n=1 Tax=Streptomyces sp. B1866 TaxID=3075431 RepID=UPI00288EA63C|nr:LCP family protein [Streptomyces sp. B1866]MDT3400731.1 LCP family protein [Streptomyces sp. B1866]
MPAEDEPLLDDSAARPGPRPRRRRWGLRLAAVTAGLVLAAGGLGHGVVTSLESGIHRVDAFDGLDDRPRAGGGGVTFLLVGTDGRDAITPDLKERYKLGGAPCHCTDTVMLVHLSAKRDRASVISLPRDSYVRVPVYTNPITGVRRPAHPGKLNAAYAEGGPSLTVRTVERMTGVHIDHYLEVDFTSFMKTVDAVGGVEVCTRRPLRDVYTGLDLPAGRNTLGGGEALQYVRSRHVDGAADLGRMRRQQYFLAAVIRKATDSGMLLNPVRLHRVTSALLGSVRADRDFDAADMIGLGRGLRGFTPASSEFVSVPVRDPAQVVKGLGSTVAWDRPKAARLFQAVREDRPLAPPRPKDTRHGVPAVAVPPAQVGVQVYNGTGQAGLGRRVDRALRATGFAVTGAPAEAPAHGVRRTVIAYDPKWDRSARALATALPGARLRPVAGQGPRMRVTVGTDFAGVRAVRARRPVTGGAGPGVMTGDQAGCRGTGG